MDNRIEPVIVVRVEAAEMDEIWSFVQSKKQQLWLWSAIDHGAGKMLAYVLAPPEDAALIQLKHLLATFGLTYFASRLLANVPPIAGAAICGTLGKANTHLQRFLIEQGTVKQKI
jgi:insertion element IS1 protein InsB